MKSEFRIPKTKRTLNVEHRYLNSAEDKTQTRDLFFARLSAFGLRFSFSPRRSELGLLLGVPISDFGFRI
jgi:hypothetical protein